MLIFPVSGVETYWWLPFITALAISSLTSVGGVSGAFLLLPFQMTVLGFTGAGVSATNLLYNIIAIPGGVYRFIREGRMIWSLTVVIIIGTLPGVFAGMFVRIFLLPDPRYFKLFVAAVIAYIAVRLAVGTFRRSARRRSAGRGTFRVSQEKMTRSVVSFDFEGETYIASTPGIFLLSLAVGIVGGTYGIGGGAIIAPFLVAVFGLPVHTVAGAALMGTFITSVAGVIFYALVGPLVAAGMNVQPDWLLGLLFGLGGMAGIYLGARLQRFLPARLIQVILLLCMAVVVVKYVWEFLAG